MDPNTILIIPYSHYYRMGGPPNIFLKSPLISNKSKDRPWNLETRCTRARSSCCSVVAVYTYSIRAQKDCNSWGGGGV